MKPKIKGPIIAGNEAHKKAAFKQGDCSKQEAMESFAFPNKIEN